MRRQRGSGGGGIERNSRIPRSLIGLVSTFDYLTDYINEGLLKALGR